MPGDESSKPRLSLEEVAQFAKTVTLEDGYHRPTVIVEGALQVIATQLESIAPTHEGRAQQMFMLGAVLAERSELGVLQQVFFITEAWMSIATKDNPPRILPSQDPQRKEILAVSRMTFLPPQTEMVIYEMKRDSEGKLISLEDIDRKIASENEVQAESPLLEAFAIGFLGSALKSND
jgi:hypothetical protein